MIAALAFTSNEGGPVVIEGTDMNRGGRLFFQGQAFYRGLASISEVAMPLDNDVLTRAREYFAELWEPNPVPGKRKLLDAIRSSSHVNIIWK
jgi:hypothetical protein